MVRWKGTGWELKEAHSMSPHVTGPITDPAQKRKLLDLLSESAHFVCSMTVMPKWNLLADYLLFCLWGCISCCYSLPVCPVGKGMSQGSGHGTTLGYKSGIIQQEAAISEGQSWEVLETLNSRLSQGGFRAVYSLCFDGFAEYRRGAKAKSVLNECISLDYASPVFSWFCLGWCPLEAARRIQRWGKLPTD